MTAGRPLGPGGPPRATLGGLSVSRYRVVVCRGPECGERRHSRAIHEAFRRNLLIRGLSDRVDLGWQSCFGRCTQGPNCLVQELLPAAAEPRFTLAALPPPRGSRAALYNGMTEADVLEVIERHVAGGELVRRLIQPLPRPAVSAIAGDSSKGD